MDLFTRTNVRSICDYLANSDGRDIEVIFDFGAIVFSRRECDDSVVYSGILPSGVVVNGGSKDVLYRRLVTAISDEPEESGVEGAPFDTKMLSVARSMISVQTLVDMIDEERLNLNPGFQRNVVWSKPKRARLIEAIIMGLPIPQIIIDKTEDVPSVVDGLQRLNTLHSFLANGEKMVGFRHLVHLDGMAFDEMPASVRRIITETPIPIVEFLPPTPHRVKLLLFEAINTGASALNAQEVRDAVGYGLPAGEFMRKGGDIVAAYLPSVSTKRGQHREMALRWLAFVHFGSFDYGGRMAVLLSNTFDALNDEKIIVSRALDALDEAISDSLSVFGEDAFRIPDENKKRPVSKAVFDAIAVNVATAGPDIVAAIVDSGESLRDDFSKSVIQSEEIMLAFASSTTTITAVLRRFGFVNELLMRRFNELEKDDELGTD